MKTILWVCNTPLPEIQRIAGINNYNEGWLIGISNQLRKREEIALHYAFPQNRHKKTIERIIDGIHFWGFYNCHKNLYIVKDEGIQTFKEIINQVKPDVIHINIYNAISLIYAKIAKKYCKKVIVHSHSEGFENDKLKIKLLLNNISRLILGSKDFDYIACSSNSAEFCFPKKTEFKILKNGIDINKFDYNENIRSEYRKNLKLENSFVIGNIGRFAEQKNQLFLIDVLKKIIDEKENAKLLLIGDGENREQILRKIDDLKINNNVVILSNRNDIHCLLQAIDVFVLPSLFEGLPVVAIEAQRCWIKMFFE